MAADRQHRGFIEARFLAYFRLHHADYCAVPDNFLHNIDGDTKLREDLLFPGIGPDIIKLRRGRKRKFRGLFAGKEIIENIRHKKQVFGDFQLRIFLQRHRVQFKNGIEILQLNGSHFVKLFPRHFHQEFIPGGQAAAVAVSDGVAD